MDPQGDTGVAANFPLVLGAAFAQQAETIKAWHRVLKPGLAKLAAEIKEAEAVLGCSYDEIVDRTPNEPPEYGKVTASEIVRAGQMGYRGYDAVDIAASWHRLPSTASSRNAAPCRVVISRRSSRRPREHRRTSRRGASRASPTRKPDDDPDHALARSGGRVSVPRGVR